VYARASQRGWPASLVACGAFVASEQLFPLLFPWYLADCVHSMPTFAQSADLGGPVFCGLLLFGSSLALEEIVVAKLFEKRKVNAPVVVAGFLATALSAVYGFVRVRQVDARAAAAPQVHVGYAQSNLGLMQNYTQPEQAMARNLRLTKELRDKGTELVIWSESSVTRGASANAYKSFYKGYVGQRTGVPTIFGGIIFGEPEPGATGRHRERLYNTALATNARGDVTGRYDKEFLLAFGEYLPFGETFPVLYEWSPNSGHFTSGTELDPLPVEMPDGTTHKVSVLICYEDIIQSFTNRMVSHADPELLVNMTNDAWFGDTSEPWEHLALAQFRAVEHHRYFIRATNSGVSAIIDPVGRVLVHSKPFDQESGDAVVRWMRGTTVYEVVGDAPAWLMTALAVAGCFVRRKKKEPVATS
jgi:apolipoprotein N-acyltransferase